jgi:hypothetical protein
VKPRASRVPALAAEPAPGHPAGQNNPQATMDRADRPETPHHVTRLRESIRWKGRPPFHPVACHYGPDRPPSRRTREPPGRCLAGDLPAVSLAFHSLARCLASDRLAGFPALHRRARCRAPDRPVRCPRPPASLRPAARLALASPVRWAPAPTSTVPVAGGQRNSPRALHWYRRTLLVPAPRSGRRGEGDLARAQPERAQPERAQPEADEPEADEPAVDRSGLPAPASPGRARSPPSRLLLPTPRHRTVIHPVPLPPAGRQRDRLDEPGGRKP